MFSQGRTSEFTENYWDDIHMAANAIRSADRVVIGVGSGMTAAGGLCYTDPILAEKWYPEYHTMGKKSIIDIMAEFWPTTINKKNAAVFWGFWAKHIYHIRYEPGALQPYKDLYRIINAKEHFICSTNVDGQLEKAGFERNKIFAPQGDYALFQCEKPCSQDVYDNKIMIETMLANMETPLEIRQDDIPICPRCGKYMKPNLRCDFSFVEKPHLKNIKQYEQFLSKSYENNLVLIELGVGLNTPGIIRYPFETITSQYPETRLLRINLFNASFPKAIESKAISIRDDVGKVLGDILANTDNIAL